MRPVSLRSPALAICAVLALSSAPGPTLAAGPLPIVPGPPATTGVTTAAVPNRLIVRWAKGTPRSERANARAADQVTRVRRLGLANLELVDTGAQPAGAVAARLAHDPHVAYAEPDYLWQPTWDPTGEDYFNELWGLENTGQTVQGTAGDPGIDIGLPAAAATSSGGEGVVVAVMDDGVDFTHPDLVGQAWVNPGESGNGRETNGIDDDGNGYVDDVNGWDFVHHDNTVHDQDLDYHGTHVSGTIAAALNGVGVVGVAPNARIMALKFIGSGGGSTSNAIEALAYAVANGAQVVNASWGGPGFSQSLHDAIEASGLLFVAAAGNDGVDNDTSPNRSYPAAYDLKNVLSVAAVDANGQLAGFSNYGATSVDLAAPGVNILSDYPATSTDPPALAFFEGTSMAAPHVTGVAASVLAALPELNGHPAGLKHRLMDTVLPLPDTVGLTVTGGMVNDAWALDEVAPTGTAPKFKPAEDDHAKSGTLPVEVWWTANDAGSGIDRLNLQKQVDGGKWRKLTVASSGAVSVLRRLAPEHTYRFRLRIIDRAGNKSAWLDGPNEALSLHQEGWTSIAYGGTWTRPANAEALGGFLRTSETSGDTGTFTFTGRAFAWIAPRGPGMGKAAVYVDGVKVATIDLEATSDQPRRLVYARWWANAAARTVEIRVKGTVGRPTVAIDGIALID